MGAAFHLAHARPAPQSPRRKRKGGGIGDGYDNFVRRVYRDDRHTPESRGLILCLAWLMCRDPDRHSPDTEAANIWERANRVLGFNPRGGPRLASLINDDRPRYEPDRKHSAWGDRTCSAPMIRRTGLCGQGAGDHDHSWHIDPETGWRTPAWYCRRHRDSYGRGLDVALQATDFPEPIPNLGGLLPSYIVHKGGTDGWIRLYTWASDWHNSLWKPPGKHGIRADNWPRPDRPQRTKTPEPARLRLAASDGELIAP